MKVIDCKPGRAYKFSRKYSRGAFLGLVRSVTAAEVFADSYCSLPNDGSMTRGGDFSNSIYDAERISLEQEHSFIRKAARHARSQNLSLTVTPKLYVKLVVDFYGFKKGDIAKVIEVQEGSYLINVPNRRTTSSLTPNASIPAIDGHLCVPATETEYDSPHLSQLFAQALSSIDAANAGASGTSVAGGYHTGLAGGYLTDIGASAAGSVTIAPTNMSISVPKRKQVIETFLITPDEW